MEPDSSSSDRTSAAWQRFRRIFTFVALLALASAAVAVVAIYYIIGSFEWHASIATAIGIGLSVLLGGALMALVFVSNHSGHDQMAHDATGGAKDDSQVQKDDVPPIR